MESHYSFKLIVLEGAPHGMENWEATKSGHSTSSSLWSGFALCWEYKRLQSRHLVHEAKFEGKATLQRSRVPAKKMTPKSETQASASASLPHCDFSRYRANG